MLMSVNKFNNSLSKFNTQTTSFLVSLLLGLLFLFSFNLAFAAKGESQYKAAQIPNTQSCSVGRDLLSDEATYDKTDITGALPYSRHYETTLSDNLNRVNDMTNGQKSIGGWTDNYNNYVFVEAAGNGNAVMRLRLPGDKDDTYYILNMGTGVVQRIFSPTPMKFEAAYITYGNGNAGGFDKVGTISTNHRDRQLVMYTSSTNLNALSFYVNNHGTIYQFQYQKSIGGASVYKMIRVIYPDGKILGLSYENYGGIGLRSVADNRGHLLTFTRESYVDGNAIRSVVKSVSLTAQTEKGYTAFADQQIVTYNYKVSNWTNFENGLNERFYTISDATSNLYGTESYQYNYNAGLIGAHTNTSNFYKTPYQVPVLTDVLNNANISQLHWSYENPTTGTGWTQLRDSYKPLTSRNVLFLNRNYAGTNSSGDAWSTNYNYTADARIVSTSSAGSIASSGNANSPLVTYNFSGFPCITYNNIPVSKEIMDVRYNNVTDIYDMNGNQTHFTYDSLNRVATVEEAVGTPQYRKTTYTYGSLSDGSTNKYNTPTIISSPEVTITNFIRPSGRVIQTMKSYSQSGSATQYWNYGYFEDSSQSNYGLLQWIQNPRAAVGLLDDTVWYAYDMFGNIAAQSVIVTKFSTGTTTGHTTQYSNYNSAGLPKTINYPDGTVDQISYDAGYRILTKSHGNSSTSITSANNLYDLIGQLKSSTDADGKTTLYEYDSIGRLTKTTQPNGNIEQNIYHPNNVIYVKQLMAPSGYLFETQWQDLDASGRVTYIRPGSENRLWTSLAFDGNGNVTMSRTAAGIINTWSYDALNRVVSHTDGNGHTDTKEYDGVGNQTKTLDAKGSGSIRTFVNQQQLNTEYNSDSNNKSYSYDLDNNLTTRGHNERQCNFGRSDQLGRNENLNCSISSSSNPDLLVSEAYTYDQSVNGNLDQVTSNQPGSNPVSGFKLGTDTSYNYDIYHRVIGKTQINNTPAKWGYASSQLKNKYTYSNAGRLNNITYPSGNSVDYNYDSSGTLNNIKLNGQAVASNISFDGANRLRSFNWGSTTATFNLGIIESGLTTFVRSTNSSGAYVFYADYSHDNDGRLTTQAYLGANATYTYDNASQLTNETLLNGSSVQYTYDNNGNRSTLRSTGNTGFGFTSADYTYYGNHLTAWSKSGGSQLLSLTGQGEVNSTYKGSATYDYAGHRRMESPLPNTGSMYFDYNHKNERTFRGGSNLDRQFMYDENSHLIGEYSLTGSMIVEYVWFDDRPIAAIYPNNRVVYLVTDYQKKPRRGVDAATQQVVWSWDSDAFGVIQAGGSVTINLRFPGQYYDQQSGLYYNHNRYYNPELGRYMEPDPLGLKAGLNPYAYAGNDPVNKTDPSGLCFEDACVGEIIAARYAIMVATPYVVQAGQYVYMNAPRIAAAAEGFLPSSAGSVSAGIANSVEKGINASEKALNIKSGIAHVFPENLIPTQTKSEISGSAVKRYAKSMKENGFDQNQPVSAVVRADGRLEISDGHHRTEAAIKAGIEKIPVDIHNPFAK